MNDHIPDAGKMVCSRCGAGVSPESGFTLRYLCGTHNPSHPFDPKMYQQSYQCLRDERDQLRARVDQWKAYAERLEESLVGIANAESAPDIDVGGEMQFGLHCGVEDRGCSDRYDAADYGYSRGVERALEWAVNEAAHTLHEAKQTKPEGLR